MRRARAPSPALTCALLHSPSFRLCDERGSDKEGDAVADLAAPRLRAGLDGQHGGTRPARRARQAPDGQEHTHCHSQRAHNPVRSRRGRNFRRERTSGHLQCGYVRRCVMSPYPPPPFRNAVQLARSSLATSTRALHSRDGGALRQCDAGTCTGDGGACDLGRPGLGAAP